MNGEASGADARAAPVTSLKGVGQAMADRLAGLGVRSVEDVLFHLPFRYQDRTRLTPIGALEPGREAVVRGEVLLADVVIQRRRSLLVRVADGTGSMLLRFFHFGQSQVRQFERGARVQCFGEVRRGPSHLEMVHPEYRVLRGHDDDAIEGTLTAFYPATEGIQQPTLRKLTDQALERLDADALPDWLPAGSLTHAGLPALGEALRTVHRPPPDADVEALLEGLHPAIRRLAFEELVAHRLGLRRLRAEVLVRDAPGVRPGGSSRAVCAPRCPSSSPRRRSACWWRSCGTCPRPSPCCVWCRATWARARPWWPRSPPPR